MYDTLGNPTTYRGNTLTWERIRLLKSYGTNLASSYNAEGIRTRKYNPVTDATIASYNLDGTTILSETRPSGTIYYYYGIDGICAFKYNGAMYYYGKDLQRNIMYIYDASGILKAVYLYDAWGNHTINETVEGLGTINPFRYRGYYYDTETGLYYLQSRYYDPVVGRYDASAIYNILWFFP